ncbi:MATE family efflux transporter [Sinorhizobium numidicum]|uniref:Multidrug-efflux transporter n=1 Tax=Sinorhizobium numidicum TaxID=680248 RepID=A0ABY8CX84_9HYPH|nr:MATE family efflux transporter [Sinorhizobium numidicum]WEX75839.1 MATE family efflux transporter [Sinorhizobium numidicum]WEX82497.1 MATE family efflux transporter [Sinorhizobium numidicum]
MLTANKDQVLPQTDNSWGNHYRASFYLGVPFIGAQLAQLAINTTDVLMVGKLGATQLAAIILATQTFFMIFIFGSGFANAVVPMAAQAQGRGDRISVRRSVRMGMWVVLLYGVLTAPILWMAEPILLFAGQKPEVAALAGEYLRIAQWAIFPSLIFMVLRAFLSGLERAGVILYVTLATLVLNAVLCYLLIYGHFGFPALGIFGAAIAALGVALLGAILTIAYIRGRPELNQYELFARFWRPDWPAFREVIHLGIPISLTILAEVSLFTVASLLMGTIGTIELAAHGIALQFASIAFMIPLGLAQAGTVRVGFAYGRGDMLGVRRAAIAVLVLGCGFAAVGSTIFALFPRHLAALYLDTSRPDAAEVLAFAGPLIVIAGAFQLVDGLQAIAAGMLRGLKDTKIPMILAMISYWPIGFFCAWTFAFPLNFGGIGVWFGFVLGLAAAALLLNWRFFRLLRSMHAMPNAQLLKSETA